ncbi:uncharacterized protein L969DRAFT_16769 [Mixia osmundae IAM 14324]|uniref:Uncharacterized protein n=1 Tax=Mixia osmundae (strain CBS 9802 / IAM 14324 / JCM 22182 / KY 12970) TaxID=764103 RepID=G7E9Z0_MIXOS|nr:uncharacterized protein L969DRAFT_16769 [Mixia osmundae IAM 14324]KEI40093.1 hypothetical protein L969DRAFT_16769 [Mixia osmundae IAM 14324]GAA99459.1 hypothetical protein E5Q_06158 [Mixia osmundae IAM 14324]
MATSVRISSAGSIEGYVAVALRHLREKRTALSFSNATADSSASVKGKTRARADQLEHKTLHKLITVVELVKREYTLSFQPQPQQEGVPIQLASPPSRATKLALGTVNTSGKRRTHTKQRLAKEKPELAAKALSRLPNRLHQYTLLRSLTPLPRSSGDAILNDALGKVSAEEKPKRTSSPDDDQESPRKRAKTSHADMDAEGESDDQALLIERDALLHDVVRDSKKRPRMSHRPALEIILSAWPLEEIPQADDAVSITHQKPQGAKRTHRSRTQRRKLRDRIARDGLVNVNAAGS